MQTGTHFEHTPRRSDKSSSSWSPSQPSPRRRAPASTPRPRPRLQALTEVMAQEWAAWNIRVNALAPGSYHSDLTDSAIATIPGYGEGMVAAALIPRIAETEEILNPVFYLASESYTTGITLVADGGLMAKR